MSDKPRRIDLTVYLAKTEVTEPSQIIKATHSLKSYSVKIEKEQIGTLFIKAAYSTPPRWSKFFTEVIPQSEFGQNSSTGAVFILSERDRICLVTFGQGRHMIDSKFLEMNFGLRVALNLLDTNSIRSIDKSSFESYPKQAREQTGIGTEIQYFGIDIERDLLRGITGKPKDRSYGDRISGMDALKISIEVSLLSLKELLPRLLTSFEDESYKYGPFAWVDHIGQVKDTAVSENLDQELITKIKTGEIDKIWLSAPGIIDWDRVVGFRYGKSPRLPRFYDTRIPDFIQSVGGEENLDKGLLERRKIYCVDADDQPVLDYSVYRYIYAEMISNSRTYLLNGGKWYLIDQDYARQVNDFYNHFTRYGKSLPIYDDETEGDYNVRVSKTAPGEFALLDKKVISLPGMPSPVEACDLYRAEREFIHIKRYGGSSVLSHLFNQGLVSGELFQMEDHFREEVNKKLPKQHKLSNLKARPTLGQYKIIYAIISKSDETLSIPFFSKISLRHCANRLKAVGFDIALAKISVSRERKVTKKYPRQKYKKWV